MAWFLRRAGSLVLTFLVISPWLQAQERIDDRPKLYKEPPLTREELDRQKAEQLFKHAQTIFGLGVMRYRADRWLEAVNMLEQAAKLDPDTPAAYRALIPIYMSLAREDDALVACRKVLERDPADCDTAFQLAKLLKADGKPREAIASLSQGVDSKRAAKNPALLYYMLVELSQMQEKDGDFTSAAATYERLVKHLIDQRIRLLGSETLSPEKHAIAAAGAYERIGHCCLARKRYGDAIKAFDESRAYLQKQPDAETQMKAIRLHWNLAQVYLTQEDWTGALKHLDLYLVNNPLDPEPYEKRGMVLRKLSRDREVVPSLKRYAQGVPDALGVQLLLAREMSVNPENRREAETLYLQLADRFTNPDIYRGLFKLYETTDRMIEVLNFIDRVFTTLRSHEEIPATERERARERGRNMLLVLKSEPSLVGSLLLVVKRELYAKHERKLETWHFLAGMAARVRKLDRAEELYRQCLNPAPPPHLEAAIYSGLLDALWMQKKYDEVITVCRNALYGPGKVQNTNAVLFHAQLAAALTEKEKWDEALAECDKAIKLSAETPKIRCQCQRARILGAAERYDAAIAESEAMLKQLTDPAEIKLVRYSLSTIFSYKGDHEKSEGQLLKILEDDPNDAGANNDLGYHWADRNKNLDEAERMIRKAIEVDRLQRRDDVDADPDNAAYLDSLG